MGLTSQMEYNDVHRAFLQALIGKRIVNLEEGQEILAHALDTDEVTTAMFEEYVQACNEELGDLDLEIRRSRAQNTGNMVWAIVNTVSDEVMQGATMHTPEEIAFFRLVLDEIFDANNTRDQELLAVSSSDALNLVKGENDFKSFTMKKAEGALDAFVDEGWLEVPKPGYYTLAPRGLLELRGYLFEAYNAQDSEEEQGPEKIKTCNSCQDIVTMGQRCHDPDCPIRMHHFCAEQLFQNSRQKVCPRCSEHWTGKDYVGVKALGAVA